MTGARRSDAAAQASYEATLAAIRSEVKSELGKGTRATRSPAGTAGHLADGDVGSRPDGRRNQGGAAERDGARPRSTAARSAIELRRALLLRQPRQDQLRHGRVTWATGTSSRSSTPWWRCLRTTERASGRKIVSVKVVYRGKEIPAKVVDFGDADAEVQSGDWAIIHTRDARSAGAATPTPATRTTSRARFSGWATTTRRASSSRPATSASGHPTVS